MSGFCSMCGAQGHHEVWCEIAKKPKADRYDLPRWLLETHNDKRNMWQQEATWHDGFSLRGTPRIERAVLEGRALVDEGFSARITDLRTGRIFYPAQWGMLAPNLPPPNAELGTGDNKRGRTWQSQVDLAQRWTWIEERCANG